MVKQKIIKNNKKNSPNNNQRDNATNNFAWKKLFTYILFLAAFPLIFIVSKNEWIAAVWILLLIGTLFLIEYHKREWILFIVGIIAGIIGEIGGDLIYKMQYWDNGSFFGIPIWLPIIWGYGFVLMYRIGKVIVRE